MTIRKLTSIILAIVMIISISVITVSADYDAVIAENETVAISASYKEAATVKFVAAETKKLALKSDSYDIFCTAYDENHERLGWLYSDGASVEYEFEAGKTYYFEIMTYSMKVVTINITLECAHSYVGDTCEWCGKVCDHNTEISYLKICECGYAFCGTDIKCGDTVSVSGSDSVIRFVPEETGAYILRSDSEDNDPACDLFCGTEYVDFADDFGYDWDFVLFAELEAGVTYYYYIIDYGYEAAGAFNVTLSKAVHTAEDGAEHPIEYHDFYWGTCQEMTYTAGLYCAECDEYIEGHLEDGYGWHDDLNEDYICDLCGEIMIEDLLFYSDFSIIFDIMIEFLIFIEEVITVMFEIFGIDENDFPFSLINAFIG